MGHPRYPSSPGTPSAVAPTLAALRQLPGHNFWPDNISLMDSQRIHIQRLLSHGQVTDSYLLALAIAHGGRLVVDAVAGGAAGLRGWGHPSSTRILEFGSIGDLAAN